MKRWLEQKESLSCDVRVYDKCDVETYISNIMRERDRVVALGGRNIRIGCETNYGYYDDKWDEYYIYYELEESDAQYEKRLIAEQKARDRAVVSAKKSKAKKEQEERKLYEKLKKKYAISDTSSKK